MVRLREIPRTSTFAWSPGSYPSFIATGTVAGAVDADFSNTTQLELWDLELQKEQSGVELTPRAFVNTESRFYDIAWDRASNDRPNGIIAGALESGALDLWSADALLSGSDGPRLSSTTKHSGAIKSLQFNPFKSELLLTAGAQGEIFVWDLNNIENPFSLGNRTSRADDVDSVDWNKKIPHILASASSGGFVTIWDVKSKRESLTLNNMGRRPVSAVAWHPDNATKLITAIPDDTNPVILVWDLRNSNAPERTLTGHEQGVLSLSWCKQDSDLLLSSGKDNKTICWNPQTGERLGDFPIVTNWTYQTRWNPTNPSLLATASFDGKIAVHTLQTCKADANRPDAANSSLDGEDFFNQASVDPQGPSFSLKQTPKWLQVPAGVSFGFGGKLVHFGTTDGQPGHPKRSKVTISKFEVETGVTEAALGFEKALQSEDLANITSSHAENAKNDEEKEVWEVLQILTNPNPREKIREYLGFSQSDEEEQSAEASADSAEAAAPDSLEPANEQSAKDKRLSSFFADSNADSEFFLSDLASIPSTRGARTNNPFQLYTGGESEADKKITRALILGQFEKAVDICLKEDRLSDAFMLAVCGGDKCTEKVRTAYLTKKAKGPNYLRLLASVIGKNMWDVVYNADLADWKEVMVTLCTFTSEDDFQDLCEVLGDRLLEDSKSGNPDNRKAAALCFLAGAKLQKIITIWAQELQESESAELQSGTGDSGFSIHVRSLQNFIEKVTLFRKATKFQDPELELSGDWKLNTLYEKYSEYADVLAALGHLEIAEKYLNLLPTNYPAAASTRARVKEATKKAGTVPTTGSVRGQQPARQPAAVPAANMYAPNRTTYNAPAQPAQTTAGSLYAPPGGSAPAVTGAATSAYAPKVNTQTGYAPNPYQPVQAVQPSPTTYGGTNQLYTPALGGYGAPPQRTFSPSTGPAPTPAAKRTDIPNWNDTPIITNLSRRATPAASQAPITSPFPNAPAYAGAAPSPPPASNPYGAPPPAAGRAPPPPPPKNAAPPQRAVSQNSVRATPPPPTGFGGYAPPPAAGAPPQASASKYAPVAPPPGAPGAVPPPAMGRQSMPPPPSAAQSPYAARPNIGAPPMAGQTYAPPPAASPYAPPPPAGGARSQYAPPPPGVGAGPYGAPPPAANPYGAPPTAGAGPYGAPPQQSNAGPYGAPPGRPTSGMGTQQLPDSGPPSKPQTPAPPPSSKHPRGDRTHIPDQWKPIYEILSNELARIKPTAPESFKKQVVNTEKRLNILFDHINNEELLSADTLTSLLNLAQAVQAKNHDAAQAIALDLITHKTDECTHWITGVKRLVEMSRVTP